MLLSVCAALAITAGVGTASAGGGNSEAAKACQQGAWQDWRRADLTPFANQGDCVSYAGQGGTLTAPSAAQLLCESFGGTFANGSGTVIWSCVGWVWNGIGFGTMSVLADQCFLDGGNGFSAGWDPDTLVVHDGRCNNL